MTSRFPLAMCSSKKRRAMALFSSASDDKAASSFLPPTFLYRVDTIHDATRKPAAHRLEVYSPECVEGEFSEVLRRPDPMRQGFLRRVSEVRSPIYIRLPPGSGLLCE